MSGAAMAGIDPRRLSVLHNAMGEAGLNQTIDTSHEEVANYGCSVKSP